ncbi:hypothetical protein [Kibdelosporangium aridum]|uniref:Uncharacterized protein n=1 Tax=Kibdelosporangium aridum TaxID=2030 RepID=A0A1W2DL92_KIBAR|nr:hypothetical protein [Kibdelosporangium aridum]SMC98270.1 hypothetical protein SAMN05661093_03520 [Kibdelosporangium aridum]
MQDADRPVFASTSRGRKFVRLTSRLLAVGMIVIAVVIVATTFGSVHNDSATPWPVTDLR